MLPIVFKEQTDSNENQESEEQISFRDYKIDYNDFLGEGTYGTVYS